MYSATSTFDAQVKKTSRQFKARLTIGKEVIQKSVVSLAATLGSCGDTAFSFGTVFSGYIEAEIATEDITLANKELFAEIGLVLADGSLEYVPLGYYTAGLPDITKNLGKTTLKAVDRMAQTVVTFTPPTLPATIKTVLSSVESQTGVKVVTSLDTSGTISSIPDGITCQDALGYIAGVLGGFCYADCAGAIRIAAYPTKESREIDAKVVTDVSYKETTYTVAQIDIMKDGETTFTDSKGTGVVVSIENPCMTQTLFDAMKSRLLGYSYRPGTVAFLGDPRLCPEDAIKLSENLIPCMSITHDFDGGLTTTITAPGQTPSDVVKGPMQEKIDDIEKKADDAKNTAEDAKNTSDKVKESNKTLIDRVDTAETEIKKNTEEIKLRATKTELQTLRDDTDGTITALKDEVGSEINQSAESIKSSVYEKVYQKEEVEELVSSVSTEIEQTKDSWQITFDEFKKDVNEMSDGNDAAFDEIKKYIRFEDGNILLGNSVSPLILKIQNDRIQFLQNGYEVAYISDQKMYNTVCEIISQLRIGDSAWITEKNSLGDDVVSLIGI